MLHDLRQSTFLITLERIRLSLCLRAGYAIIGLDGTRYDYARGESLRSLKRVHSHQTLWENLLRVIVTVVLVVDVLLQVVVGVGFLKVLAEGSSSSSVSRVSTNWCYTIRRLVTLVVSQER